MQVDDQCLITGANDLCLRGELDAETELVVLPIPVTILLETGKKTPMRCRTFTYLFSIKNFSDAPWPVLPGST